MQLGGPLESFTHATAPHLQGMLKISRFSLSLSLKTRGLESCLFSLKRRREQTVRETVLYAGTRMQMGLLKRPAVHANRCSAWPKQTKDGFGGKGCRMERWAMGRKRERGSGKRE